MLQPPPQPSPPLPEGASIAHVLRPSPAYYRYLYNAVGGGWHWRDRRELSDSSLTTLLQAPGVEVHVLALEGSPAGYVEFEFEGVQAKIAYFGLVPECIGRGLGGRFLDWCVATAWSRNIQRLWLHTCNLDHPNALVNYQKRGFKIFDQRSEPNHYRSQVRLAYIQLVASNWKRLRDFYCRVFDCQGVPPLPDLTAERLETPLYLRMPGHGPQGPLLGISENSNEAQSRQPGPHRLGLDHLAFWVADLETVLNLVERHGGTKSDVMIHTQAGERQLKWAFVLDPEDNRIRLTQA